MLQKMTEPWVYSLRYEINGGDGCNHENFSSVFLCDLKKGFCCGEV